nr:trigger factor [Ardenticatena sp.]
MNIERKDLENAQVELTITVDEARFEKAKKAAARKLAREVKIPGFRPGKAPYHIVVQRVGEATVLEEALETLVPQVIGEAIEQEGIEPWSYRYIDLNVESLSPLTIEVIVPLPPKVELGDLSNIEIEQEEIEVTEDEINAVLQNLREQRAMLMPTTGPAEYGDVATIDLVGTLVTGETVIELKGHEVELNPMFADEDETSEIAVAGEEEKSAQPKPDLIRELKGMVLNQTKEFTLTYPEDWPDERIAGRTVMYKATLLDLKRRVLPELDDELAQAVGDFETIEDLRNQVRENLYEEAHQAARSRLVEQVLDKVAEVSTIVYPPAMVEAVIDTHLHELEHQLQVYGLNLEQYLQMLNKSLDELREEYREAAEKDLRRELVLYEYAKERNIEIEQDEYQKEASMALTNLLQSGADPLILQDENLAREIARGLYQRKALNKLVAEVTGQPEEPLFPKEIEEVWRRAEEEEGKQAENAAEAEQETEEAEGEATREPPAAEEETHTEATAEAESETSAESDT